MQCNTVLIVEDEKDIRETLAQILDYEGYNVATAKNGKDALEALRTAVKPCLILLDLMMPVMTGWEFLHQQRQDVILATIPVVIVSAAGAAATTTGAEAFIKKPVELDSLLKLVRQYCRKR